MVRALLQRGPTNALALEVFQHEPACFEWAQRNGAGGCSLAFVVASILEKESKVHLRDRAGYYGPVVQLALDMADAAGAEPGWNSLFGSEAKWGALAGSEQLESLRGDYTGTLLDEPPERQPPMPPMGSGMGGTGGMSGMGGKNISELLAQLQAMNGQS